MWFYIERYIHTQIGWAPSDKALKMNWNTILPLSMAFSPEKNTTAQLVQNNFVQKIMNSPISLALILILQHDHCVTYQYTLNDWPLLKHQVYKLRSSRRSLPQFSSLLQLRRLNDWVCSVICTEMELRASWGFLNLPVCISSIFKYLFVVLQKSAVEPVIATTVFNWQAKELLKKNLE